mgnify:CR=1 FL=1|tara:strand:- start:481 stop:2352 length:1872 start_codon:yes stop_codon:yes gene_type:complete
MSNNLYGYAPYAQIPLAPKVILPDWQSGVSYTSAQQGAVYDGTLQVTLSACSELFTSNGVEEKGALQFNTNPSKQLCINGSSIRSMLRNVVEIAGFGKTQFVDNHVVATRTPDDPSYLGEFVSNGHDNAKRKPHSGWLSYNEKQKSWELRLCDSKSFSYEQMANFNLRDAAKLDAKAKYQRIKPYLNIKKTNEEPGLERFQRNKYGQWKAVFVGKMKQKTGDYLFKSTTSGKAIKVKPEVFQNFKTAHSNRQSHFHYLLTTYIESEGRIPVFAWFNNETSADDKTLAFLSLSKLPKLVAKAGPLDILNRLDQKRDNVSVRLDLPELLFGRVHDDKKSSGIEQGLKNRISCSDFIFTENVVPDSDLRAYVLNSPQASFTPAYLLPNNGKCGSYLQDTPKMKGSHKLYFRAERDTKRLSEKTLANSKLKNLVTKLSNVMPKGARFEGTITFKNLNEVELGALLWAITLGNNQHNKHHLGMAKTFGFGSTELNVNVLTLRSNDTINAAKKQNLDDIFKQLSPKQFSSLSDDYKSLFNKSISAFEQFVSDEMGEEFNTLEVIQSLQNMLKYWNNVPNNMSLESKNVTASLRQEGKLGSYDKARKGNQGAIPMPLQAIDAYQLEQVKA